MPRLRGDESKSCSFIATIYRVWMMRHVNVSEEIVLPLLKSSEKKTRETGERKKPKYIPVVAIVGGRSARTTLVPAGDGQYRLQIKTVLRKAANADAGDSIRVELRIDRKSRAIPVPHELAEALKTRPKARKAFEKMGPGTRRQLLMWFGSAKAAAVREKRLARLLEILLERSLLGRQRPRGRKS
jgi:hypothetical protein